MLKSKPRLTKRVLDGICEALNRMEADDISDLSREQQKDLDAANRWLQGMNQWRSEAPRRKIVKQRRNDPVT